MGDTTIPLSFAATILIDLNHSDLKIYMLMSGSLYGYDYMDSASVLARLACWRG